MDANDKGNIKNNNHQVNIFLNLKLCCHLRQ